MNLIAFDDLADWALRPDTGWSIGAFGAIGEFVRDPDEPAEIRREAGCVEIVTARGALRIRCEAAHPAVAWDSLASDGETWSHALAVCTPQPADWPTDVRELGPDANALCRQDRDAVLFDLGVAVGAVRMAVRTRDAALIAALRRAVGRPMLEQPAVGAEVLRAQPHRVLMSPVARIEVYQPIPPPDSKSPPGPHTHLLPKLIATQRAHSANTPIPRGWQSAATLHPPSPWRTPAGERRPFDAACDAAFAPLLERYAPVGDEDVERGLADALDRGVAPDQGLWPTTRRGRAKARLCLRRRAAAGDDRVAPWRARFDRLDAAQDDAVDEDPA